ncbi:MAG: hypothetical protein O3B01_13235 [Planctomycetota bacterium]|nr:hypothetical protein [Planctomycetota bacterium]
MNFKPDIETIFNGALDLESPDAVNDYLDEMCGDNTARPSTLHAPLPEAHSDHGRLTGGEAAEEAIRTGSWPGTSHRGRYQGNEAE